MPKKDLEIQNFLKYLQDNGNMEKLGTNSDNKNAAIHRWFSFLPGFSHAFVENTFNFFNVTDNNYLVFDPFMGSATTAVVGKKIGIDVVGNESHRFLYEISKAKTYRVRKPKLWDKISTDILKRAKNKWKEKKTDKENPLLLKCYSKNNLKKLTTLRDIYYSKYIPNNYKPLIFVAISALLPKCSKVGISIPYVSWNHTHIAKEPFHFFKAIIGKIKEDLSFDNKLEHKNNIKIYLHDSRIVNNKINSSSVDLIFTSPPYLNNFDYGEALKVYTYFWGFTKNWNEVTKKIRRKSVTSATTHYREREFTSKTPKEVLGNIMVTLIPKTADKIIEKVNLINKAKNKKNRKKSFGLLTALYFKDMFQVIQEIHRVLKDDGLSFIVIGDSAPYGIYVPTDEILGKMAVELGFSNFTLSTLRPRGLKWINLRHRHKLRLRESILILRK